jgi:hypothetical protein
MDCFSGQHRGRIFGLCQKLAELRYKEILKGAVKVVCNATERSAGRFAGKITFKSANRII